MSPTSYNVETIRRNNFVAPRIIRFMLVQRGTMYLCDNLLSLLAPGVFVYGRLLSFLSARAFRAHHNERRLVTMRYCRSVSERRSVPATSDYRNALLDGDASAGC